MNYSKLSGIGRSWRTWKTKPNHTHSPYMQLSFHDSSVVGSSGRAEGYYECTCNMMDNHREVLAWNPLVVVIVFTHTTHWLWAITHEMSDPIKHTFYRCRSCAKSSERSLVNLRTSQKTTHPRDLSPSITFPGLCPRIAEAAMTMPPWIPTPKSYENNLTSIMFLHTVEHV